MALRGRPQSDGSWMARCPAHPDQKPSLHINAAPDGTILLKCFAGCTFDAVRQACHDRGLWHDEPHERLAFNGAPFDAPPKRPSGPLAAILPVPRTALTFDPRSLAGEALGGCWDYLDSQGRLLGYAVRANATDGSKAWVKPVVWTTEGWKAQAFPTPRPLYGLADLAQRPEAPVLIVEGEKTACAARVLFEDRVCMTWPGGSSAVAQADWRRLKGRHVTIWPDADEPGAKAAQAVADAALKVGALEARIVELPAGLSKGWDLADPIPAGMDVAELIATAINVRAAKLGALPIQSLVQIDATEYPPLKWAVPGLIPSGVTILAGPKSRGKSFIVLDFALAVQAGGHALGGILCEQGDVLYLALEDGRDRIKHRSRAILQGRPAPNVTVATEWRVLPDGLEDIETWIDGTPKARLVIIDVLAKVKGSPDRHRGVYDQDYALITPFHALARKHRIAIVLVHHTNKGMADDPVLRISGSMGLSGAADTTLVLSRNARDPNGTLDVRGRDVPEREIALQFDPDTGCVMELGPAADFRKTEQRRQILRTLIGGGPMTPIEVAEALGKNRSAIRYLLMQMRKTGEIRMLPDGKYQANE